MNNSRQWLYKVLIDNRDRLVYNLKVGSHEPISPLEFPPSPPEGFIKILEDN